MTSSGPGPGGRSSPGPFRSLPPVDFSSAAPRIPSRALPGSRTTIPPPLPTNSSTAHSGNSSSSYFGSAGGKTSSGPTHPRHGAGAGSVAPKTPSTKYFNSAQDPGQGQSSYYPTTTKPKSYTTTSAADPYYAPQASQANYSSQASQVNQDYYYDDGQYQDGYDDCYYDELGRPVDPYYDQQYDNGSGYSGYTNSYAQQPAQNYGYSNNYQPPYEAQASQALVRSRHRAPAPRHYDDDPYYYDDQGYPLQPDQFDENGNPLYLSGAPPVGQGMAPGQMAAGQSWSSLSKSNWILIGIVLVLVLGAILFFVHRWYRNKHKRDARLKQEADMADGDADDALADLDVDWKSMPMKMPPMAAAIQGQPSSQGAAIQPNNLMAMPSPEMQSYMSQMQQMLQESQLNQAQLLQKISQLELENQKQAQRFQQLADAHRKILDMTTKRNGIMTNQVPVSPAMTQMAMAQQAPAMMQSMPGQAPPSSYGQVLMNGMALGPGQQHQQQNNQGPQQGPQQGYGIVGPQQGPQQAAPFTSYAPSAPFTSVAAPQAMQQQVGPPPPQQMAFNTGLIQSNYSVAPVQQPIQAPGSAPNRPQIKELAYPVDESSRPSKRH